MKNIEVMRATEEWQRAGAYSVRVQGMNRQHSISLRDEFDEHDCVGTKYIVRLDGTENQLADARHALRGTDGKLRPVPNPSRTRETRVSQRSS